MDVDLTGLTAQFNNAFEACREAKEEAESTAQYDECVRTATALRAAYSSDPNNSGKLDSFIEDMVAGRKAFLRSKTRMIHARYPETGKPVCGEAVPHTDLLADPDDPEINCSGSKKKTPRLTRAGAEALLDSSGVWDKVEKIVANGSMTP